MAQQQKTLIQQQRPTRDGPTSSKLAAELKEKNSNRGPENCPLQHSIFNNICPPNSHKKNNMSFTKNSTAAAKLHHILQPKNPLFPCPISSPKINSISTPETPYQQQLQQKNSTT
ncbi:hypothetical protein Salat_2292200 [Sesamum alatum]|uniref:Uncharacterized protein n=1 Tax=Sesamum alatum TaxID=300844 RepID=A0AAE1XVI9_9LAMI|nr:hypothetical protein Salat_2292200 [Sesamum alatum]